MIEKILESVNIGNIIKQKLIASLMPINKFADRLGCDRSVVDNIFNNESIDIDRLVRISEILDFDFIHIYYWKDTGTGSDMHVIKEMIDSVGHIHKSVSKIFNHNVNIGIIIKQYLKNKEIKFIAFSGMLDCDISAVYAIFNHKSIDIKTLIKISKILKFDFINTYYYKDYSLDFDADVLTITTFLESAGKTRINEDEQKEKSLILMNIDRSIKKMVKKTQN